MVLYVLLSYSVNALPYRSQSLSQHKSSYYYRVTIVNHTGVATPCPFLLYVSRLMYACP
jgi:hypothetical protein